MRSVTILAAALVLTSWPVAAQSVDPTALADQIQSLAIQAAIRGDDAGLREAAAIAERALAAHPKDAWLLHHRGYVLYRLASRHGCDEEKDPRCVWSLLERSEESLEASAEVQPIAETYALLASVYGLMIGENNALAPSLGGRIDVLQHKALALDPENPRVWLLKGIGEFLTPAAYGGGSDVALRSLERAAFGFEHDEPEPPAPRWGRADVHAWLGQVYVTLGQVERAREEYQRALEIEPEYAWVRDDLLPALDREGG